MQSLFDLVIRNGTLFDGTGAPPRRADLGIVGDKIAAIDDLTNASAAYVLDATNRYIAPGFIDIHTHSDETVFVNPKMESKIHQGVTTEVTGNCGRSAAPLLGAACDTMRRDIAPYENLGSVPVTGEDPVGTRQRHLGGRRKLRNSSIVQM